MGEHHPECCRLNAHNCSFCFMVSFRFKFKYINLTFDLLNFSTTIFIDPHFILEYIKFKLKLKYIKSKGTSTLV